ncbi:MAG: CBO0543 family protein [Syntrophomonadaceae bacterium]|nr:CBO0543 family protein [Syntrophomonadaceae bacterium]
MALEFKITWILVVLSLVLAFFLFSRQPIHDWVTIYALKTLITSFSDTLLVSSGRIEYPLRLLADYFNTSIYFDYIGFPLLCVLYNQTTYQKNLKHIFGQALLYSTAIVLLETWALKNTRLIAYHSGWTWLHSFVTLTLTFLLVRGIMALLRRFTRYAHPVGPPRRPY